MPEKNLDNDLRRLILDTTRHLLVEEGYMSLSMRKIARAIGYSATSIYIYFENKDALFHTLIDEGMARLYEALKAAVAAHPTDPEVRLQALCQAYIDFGLLNPEYYEVMFLLHPERMVRYPADKYRRARRNLDVIAQTLADGTEQGVFVAEDARVAASAIWGALHGIVSLLIARRVDVRIDTDDLIRASIRQTLRGVRVLQTEPSPSS